MFFVTQMLGTNPQVLDAQNTTKCNCVCRNLKELYSNLSTVYYYSHGPQRVIDKNIRESRMRSVITANDYHLVLKVFSQHDLDVITSVGLILHFQIMSKPFKKMYMTLLILFGAGRSPLLACLVKIFNMSSPNLGR